MTRINNYDIHKTYEVSTLANKSSMYWPTLNCSNPTAGSSVTDLVTRLAYPNTADKDMRQKIVVDEFEFINDGASAVRVTVDDVEGQVNESQGHVVQPGEIWNPPFRLKRFLSIYTSSNVSQTMRLTVGAYV